MLTLQYVKTLCEVTVVSPTWSETECHEPWDVTPCQVVVSDGVLFTVKHDYSKHTYNEFSEVHIISPSLKMKYKQIKICPCHFL